MPHLFSLVLICTGPRSAKKAPSNIEKAIKRVDHINLNGPGAAPLLGRAIPLKTKPLPKESLRIHPPKALLGRAIPLQACWAGYSIEDQAARKGEPNDALACATSLIRMPYAEGL